MFIVRIASLIFLLFASLAFSEELTLERLFGSTNLNGKQLKRVKISPDGSRVTYLKGKEANSRQMDLWEFLPKTRTNRLLVDSEELAGHAAQKIAEVEKARRERQRIQDTGIVEYDSDEKGAVLLFPLSGDIYYKKLAGEIRRLTETEAFETDVKASPGGNYASFIRDQDLFLLDLASG